MNNNLIDINLDKKKKLIKYLLFGLIIGISVRYIPTNKINNNEILMICAISSITFGIIDMSAPSIVVQ